MIRIKVRREEITVYSSLIGVDDIISYFKNDINYRYSIISSKYDQYLIYRINKTNGKTDLVLRSPISQTIVIYDI